jgi:glycosyltransferase involved in cell wall biosynthesis
MYFDINKHKKVLKKILFYYVGTTSYQDFNSGIQRVTRNVSNVIGNYFKEYEIFLVIYDDKNNDLRILNKKELDIFCKYNGYNHLENNNNKTELFKIIKEKGINTTLFIPELLHTNQNIILNKIIEQSKTYNCKTVHIYHDDSIYNNNELDENFRREVFDTYINIISKIDVILPNSNYSKSTYLFHKKRLNIDTNQIIKTISLPGEILNYKRIIKKPYVENYIFANLSITKRKNIGTLIKSFNLLNKEFPDVKLIICGIIYEKNEYYHSFKNDLTENILFEENKTDIEICELYQKALFSVYPSIEEGFGLPIYESLWNCTPVICHNATSTFEIANKINSKCVECVDCLNVNILYLQMKTWMDMEYLNSVYREIRNIKIKTWYQYTDEIICNLNKNNEKEKLRGTNNSITIYYYVHNTCVTNIRTGIQIFTIYLAKQLIKKNVKIVLVKWDEINNVLVPCNNKEIDTLFNSGETEDIVKEINYRSYEAIHLTDKNIKDCIFLNPEYTNPKYSSNLNIYLRKISIKTVHILHDIIPLVLDNFYVKEREFFNSYFMNNILTSDKIITISNFTKIEFLNYCKTNNLFNINKFPIVKSILSPYQYRNKKQIINNNELKCNDTISILLPGTIEPRKQQLLFMQLFNKFIQNNPEINAEIITFGHVYDKDSFDTEIEKSNGKIKYLGIIDNNQLFELYKNVSFSCFISIILISGMEASLKRVCRFIS